MPNLTLSLDEKTLKAAKIYAATHGTSISRIVREHLAEITGLRSRCISGDDALARFSRGETGRHEAMAELGIDYGTLIEAMAARRLPLPSLPEAELDAMADLVVRVLEDPSA